MMLTQFIYYPIRTEQKNAAVPEIFTRCKIPFGELGFWFLAKLPNKSATFMANKWRARTDIAIASFCPKGGNAEGN